MKPSIYLMNEMGIIRDDKLELEHDGGNDDFGGLIRKVYSGETVLEGYRYTGETVLEGYRKFKSYMNHMKT